MMNERVAVNEFVRRQTKESGKSFSNQLSFEDIALHAEVQMSAGHFKEGYREGVRIVAAAADNSPVPLSKLMQQQNCPQNMSSADLMKNFISKCGQKRAHYFLLEKLN